MTRFEDLALASLAALVTTEIMKSSRALAVMAEGVLLAWLILLTSSKKGEIHFESGGKWAKLTNGGWRHLCDFAHVLVGLHDALDPRDGEFRLHFDSFFHSRRQFSSSAIILLFELRFL